MSYSGGNGFNHGKGFNSLWPGDACLHHKTLVFTTCITILYNNLAIIWTIHNLFHYLLRFHIDRLVQDCSNSIASALELLQSCTKPSIYSIHQHIGILNKRRDGHFAENIWNEFSSKKIIAFWLKVHWCLFKGSIGQLASIGSSNTRSALSPDGNMPLVMACCRQVTRHIWP